MSFACFNDLSIQPLCVTHDDVNERVSNFLNLVKEVRNHMGVTKILHDGNWTDIHVSNNYTLYDYYKDNYHDHRAQLFLTTFITPHIDMDDEESFQKYIDTDVDLIDNEGSKIKAEGFKAAYCQNTFCVGFDSHEFWHNKELFDLSISINGKNSNVKCGCISSLDFFNNHASNAKRREDFDFWWFSVKGISLIESNLKPAEKQINLPGDHHGKEKLRDHALKLCNNPYVLGILTSLEFKPYARDYIDGVYQDGTIDIVLYWEEEGYSMKIKTTGRNIFETQEIARILKEKYSK